MKLAELIQFLEQGREIEFNLYEREYFISSADSEDAYYIWDVALKCDIITGKLEDILSYPFRGETCLKDDIEKFSFSYIL